MILKYDPTKTFYDNVIKEPRPDRVRLINTKTAARILLCHPATVGKWRREGFISYKMGGKRYFYYLHEIEAIAKYRFNGYMEKLLKRMKL